MPTKNQVTGPCANCGAIVSKAASKVTGRMFCGWACYDAQRQAECLVTKPCEGCGASVTRKGKHHKPHTFCSRPCYLASRFHSDAVRESNLRRFPAKVELLCPQCSTVFHLAPSQTANRKFCSRACMKAYAVANPVRQTTPQGYVKIFVGRDYPGATAHGHVYEHRKVMQDHIGRVLARHEDVHHVNGDRADNRLDNLELWSTSHPRGQRVEDKLRWAREFIAQYEGSPFM